LIATGKGIGDCKKEISGIDEVLDNVSLIAKNAPTTLIVDW
jgi:hypothetical protein